MNSVTHIILLICLLATLSEARRRRAKWEVSGGVDYSRDSGWAGRVGLRVSWRRKRRSTVSVH